METLLDIVGVGIFILGIFSVLGALLQAAVVGFGAGDVFGKKGGIPAAIVWFILAGAWGAFLIWAGSTIWGITP